MNKTKTILAVTGGVIGLAVLVMAYFTWSAFSAKTAAVEGDEEEGTDGLETVMDKAQGLSRLTSSHPVYPCAASLAAIESNRAAIVEWKGEAEKLATRGDRVFQKTTPPAFKTFIVSDAKRLAALPGSVAGALVKPEFAFGPFREYIVEGKMPTEAQLPELQRRWDDVATVVELLAQSGIAELTDVQFKVEAVKEEPEDARGRRRKAARSGDRRQGDDKDKKGPSAFSYVFSFTTKSAGFAKVLNALTVSERFVTVDGFTFSRAKDALAEALGGEDKKKDVAQGLGRRSRRRGVVAQEKQEAEKKDEKGGIVTDPLLEEPIAVVLTATVYDFRSLEEAETDGEAASAPSEKKGADK